MKKRITFLLCAFLSVTMIMAVFSSCNSTRGENEADLLKSNGSILSSVKSDSFTVENNGFELSFDENTATVSLKDKSNDKVWLSNPSYEDSAGGVTPVDAGLIITYYDENNQPATMDSYTNSVKNKTFAAQGFENGIKVIYTIGDKGEDTDSIPKELTEKRFNELFLENDAVDDIDKDFIRHRYLFNDDKKSWTWKETTANLYIEQMLDILELIGYSEDDLKADNAENGLNTDTGLSAFQITVEYAITESGLKVRVPLSEIKEPSKLRLQMIELLPFFGAVKSGGEGYIFVPDGSGSLINFSDNRSVSDLYSAPVYGLDYAKTTLFQLGTNQVVRMPVFGLKAEENSFLAVIEKGDALAKIDAYRAGKINNFNVVYSKFTLREMDEAELSTSTGSAIPVFQKSIPKTDIVINYLFQNGTQANYSGMANAYRDYLLQNGYSRLSPDDNIPFVLDTVGAVKTHQKFLFFHTLDMEAVTSFEQSLEILQTLQDNGIENIALKMSAWLSDGFQQKIATELKLEKALGGKKAFNKLNSYTKERGIELYPDVQFMTATTGGGFSKYGQGAKSLNQSFALKRGFDIVTGDPVDKKTRIDDPTRYIISPSKLTEITEKFLNRYLKLDATGLSVADLGDSVHADYKSGAVVDRQLALIIQEKQMAEFKAAGLNTMVSGGNIYSLKNASIVTGAPFSDSGLQITDETVPFYQMVLHGIVTLTGTPVNLAAQNETALLNAAETGSPLFYQWGYAASSVMQNTDYSNLYSLHYKDSFDSAVQNYKQLNAALSSLQDVFIVSHTCLADGVYQTQYEDGTSIIVNYSENEYKITDESIFALSFKVLEKEGNK